MTTSRASLLMAVVAVLDIAGAAARQSPARDPFEVFHAATALPTRLTSSLTKPVAYAETPAGELVVLDGRAHAAFVIDKGQTTVRKLVDLEAPLNQVSQPGALAIGPSGLIAIADAPRGVDRVRYFTADGKLAGSFFLPDKVPPPPNGPGRLVPGPLVMNNPGSLQLGADRVVIALPGRGSLATEFDLHGAVIRQIGLSRRTGQEGDPEVHVALNSGFPVIDPSGGVYYVFRTGVPTFRKYDANGALVFERHIEGPELDRRIQALPDFWPARTPGDGTAPFVEPQVNAAAIDRAGHLWISLAVPVTYVYDSRGDKIRTVQFDGVGLVAPTTLFFGSRDRLLVTPGCFEFIVKPQ